MVPTGAAHKKFINEIAGILNFWTNDTPLKNNVLKAMHIMPALLLQKRGKKSKARRARLNALERPIKLRKESNINEVLEENRTTQERLPSNITPMNIEKILSKF